MKKWLGLSIAVVLGVFLVTACSVSISGGGPRVSGTLTFFNMALTNSLSVTIQQGSNVYGTAVSYSGPGNGTQSGSFSFSDVPYGTYSFVVTFDSPYTSYVAPNTSYLINGIGPFALFPSGFAHDWTATINGISVQTDVTVDTIITH
jgi:predicted small secreted protein